MCTVVGWKGDELPLHHVALVLSLPCAEFFTLCMQPPYRDSHMLAPVNASARHTAVIVKKEVLSALVGCMHAAGDACILLAATTTVGLEASHNLT
jgi:hypothetical protein